jgi:hypothetical protein
MPNQDDAGRHTQEFATWQFRLDSRACGPGPLP